MIRRAWAGTVAGAVDLPHAAGPRSDKSLGAVHRDRLTGADGRESGSGVSAEPRGGR